MTFDEICRNFPAVNFIHNKFGVFMKQVSVLFVIIISVTIVAFPQSRVLVNPNDEVIQVNKGESVVELIKSFQLNSSSQNQCEPTWKDGFVGGPFPFYSHFGSRHKDVLGQWYVAHFTGTIDTLFFATGGVIDAFDSTVYVRIFRSNITPSAGPGIRPGPYNPPCQPWGYYLNSNDLDRGITPFKDEATDTNWVSTYNGTTPSFDPLGEEIWGYGGFPLRVLPNSIIALPLDELGYKPFVQKGEVFFVTIRINSPSYHVEGDRTEFLAEGFSSALPEYQEYYPSRIWKFYEHDSGTGGCSGFPQSQVPKGWTAHGGFTNDTLDVAMYAWWYSTTFIGNKPPTIIANELPHTLQTTPRTVIAEIIDCDSLNNEQDASTAIISYSINGIFAGTIPMTLTSGHFWIGELPGNPCGNSISWSIVAIDNEGSFSTLPMGSYNVVCLANEFSKVDTSSYCNPDNISGTGNVINAASFFKHPNNDVTYNPKDDGTAGPFPLGGTFNFYGQELRYAWVGVNGAIALSSSPTETLDVNAGGYYSSFDFPGRVRLHSDVRDTAGLGRMPYNFIAPFWNDLVYGEPISGSQYGNILWDTIGCNFIVQWDSLAAFDANGDHYLDEFVFRLILNRCNGKITFQYDDVGTAGLDTTALIGFQSDTTTMLANRAPWSFINRSGYPIETTPRNRFCFKIRQMNSFEINHGWNLVPVCTDTVDSNRSVSHLFPNATSLAFSMTKFGYERHDTVEPGVCYWIKFDGETYYQCPLPQVDTSSIELHIDWNLVSTKLPCSIPSPIDPLTISGWYHFQNGYRLSTVLDPLKCYWVKSPGGRLELGCDLFSAQQKQENITSMFSALNSLTFSNSSDDVQTLYIGEQKDLKFPKSYFELPPVAPAGLFDARFSSNNMVETFSASKVNEEYIINIQSSSFPLTLSWDASVNQTKTLVLSYNRDSKNVETIHLRGKGSVKISNSKVNQLRLRTMEGRSLPLEFALLQNYPNPFNPLTNFELRIANRELIMLKIYDVLGREIATLLNEEKDAGEYSVQWDASNVPSGVYFYKLTAGKFTDVKKLLLMK